MERIGNTGIGNLANVGGILKPDRTVNVDVDRLDEILKVPSQVIGLDRGGTVIWQGFDYRWQHHPHRLNRFDSHLDSFEVRADGKVQARYLSDFDGGSIEDVGHAITRVAALKAEPFYFIHGYASATLENDQGKASSVNAPIVEVTIPAVLGTNAVATPVLRGFDITSVNFDRGFHTRGFGIALNIVGQSGNRLRFVPHFFIHAERSPDPFTREPFSAAPGRYQYHMTAFYSVVAAPAGQARFTAAPASSPTAVTRYEGPTPAQQQVTSRMLGQAGGVFSDAVIGIRAFEWRLHNWPHTHFDGRYLRRLQCFVSNFGYNRDTGEATFIAHLWFTNDGPITTGFDAEHRLWTTLIQYNDNRPQARTSLTNVIDTTRSVTATQIFQL